MESTSAHHLSPSIVMVSWMVRNASEEKTEVRERLHQEGLRACHWHHPWRSPWWHRQRQWGWNYVVSMEHGTRELSSALITHVSGLRQTWKSAVGATEDSISSPSPSVGLGHCKFPHTSTQKILKDPPTELADKSALAVLDDGVYASATTTKSADHVKLEGVRNAKNWKNGIITKKRRCKNITPLTAVTSSKVISTSPASSGNTAAGIST